MKNELEEMIEKQRKLNDICHKLNSEYGVNGEYIFYHGKSVDTIEVKFYPIWNTYIKWSLPFECVNISNNDESYKEEEFDPYADDDFSTQEIVDDDTVYLRYIKDDDILEKLLHFMSLRNVWFSCTCYRLGYIKEYMLNEFRYGFSKNANITRSEYDLFKKVNKIVF